MTDRRLLIVSNVRWNYLWQRQQSLALAAADAGWHVTYLDPHLRGFSHGFQVLRSGFEGRGSPRESHAPGRSGNLTLMRPTLAVGVLGKTLGAELLAHQLGGAPFDAALVYLPTGAVSSLLRKLDPGRVIYDRVVDWRHAPASFFPPREYAEVESKWYQNIANLKTWTCITDNAVMRDGLREAGVPAHVVLPATDDAFVAAHGDDKREVAGFFGAVREEVDVDFLVRCGGHFETEIVGPVNEVHAERLRAAGVTMHGTQMITRLASIVATWGVVLLPYRGPRAATLTPAKAYNAFAAGGHVAARGIELPADLKVRATQLDPNDDVALEQIRMLLQQRLSRSPVQLPTWAVRWQEIGSAAGLT